MNRRHYLTGSIAGVSTVVAGCLGSVPFVGSSTTVLDPPEQSRGDPIHPIHGEELPSFSVSDPHADETVTDEQFRDDRALLMTFFLINCPSNLCPALLQRLRTVQDDARENGYEDDIVSLAMTFDPDRDTPDALEEQAEQVGIDIDAPTFRFLRPESNAAAQEIVTGDFGVPVHYGHDDHGGGTDANGDQDGQENPDMFTHYYLLLLVNERGIVERSYPNASEQSVGRITEDVRTVIGG